MLSKEQKRKVAERMEWIRNDEQFVATLRAMILSDVELETIASGDLSPNRSWTVDTLSSMIYSMLEVAMNRFEGEKVRITGRGRYAEQVDALVRGIDPFFSPYEAEIRQIGVSVFRFLHHLLTDAVGEDVAFREFTMNLTRVVQPLHAVMNVMKLVVVEATSNQEKRS